MKDTSSIENYIEDSEFFSNVRRYIVNHLDNMQGNGHIVEDYWPQLKQVLQAEIKMSLSTKFILS